MLTATALPLVPATSADAAGVRKHSARQRARVKARLLHAVEHNPRVATQRWFVRKAALFGVDVPVTFRLNRVISQAGTTEATDDGILITTAGLPTTSPLPVGVSVPTATATLTGVISGSLRFSQDTSGYGGIGVVELGFSTIQLTATGFDLVQASDPTPCGTDPVLLKTLTPVRIGQRLGSPSRGYVDLMKQVFSIDLHTSFSFASAVRSSCTLDGDGMPPPFVTTSVSVPGSDPPLPLRLDGVFRVSPALTADGRMRLGKLQTTGPQQDSFVQIHSCTQGPPSASGCAAGTDGYIPARLSATNLTAELLIGTYNS